MTRFPELPNSPSLLVYCALAISPPTELPANTSGSQRRAEPWFGRDVGSTPYPTLR